MPLWLIFHPDNTFVDNASRAAFTRDITAYYTRIGLPAFYVVVQFIHQPGDSTWVGGERPDPKRPFIRIVIEHIAVNLPDNDAVLQRTSDKLIETIEPHMRKDEGWEYEFHVDETDKRLWRVNGFVGPPFGSDVG